MRGQYTRSTFAVRGLYESSAGAAICVGSKLVVGVAAAVGVVLLVVVAVTGGGGGGSLAQEEGLRFEIAGAFALRSWNAHKDFSKVLHKHDAF